jgi:hypothetical protein
LLGSILKHSSSYSIHLSKHANEFPVIIDSVAFFLTPLLIFDAGDPFFCTFVSGEQMSATWTLSFIIASSSSVSTKMGPLLASFFSLLVSSWHRLF